RRWPALASSCRLPWENGRGGRGEVGGERGEIVGEVRGELRGEQGGGLRGERRGRNAGGKCGGEMRGRTAERILPALRPEKLDGEVPLPLLRHLIPPFLPPAPPSRGP